MNLLLRDSPELAPLPDDYLASLNAGQRAAVEHGDGKVAGPLLVIAGAGSGKTNTLAHRVAHLIVSDADPRRILLMTFSRRAASEMKSGVERIAARVMGGKSRENDCDRAPLRDSIRHVVRRGVQLIAARNSRRSGAWKTWCFRLKGRKLMPFSGVVGSEELKALTQLLDDYCLEHGIPAGKERDDVSYRIMGLYRSGLTSPEGLKVALQEAGVDALLAGIER